MRQRPAAPSLVASAAAVAGAALLLAACTSGDGKATGSTTAPGATTTTLSGGGPTTVAEVSSTTVPVVSTTLSAYRSPGERHDLPGGGTITVSYPVFPLKPGKDQPPAPEGTIYAVLSTKLCAPKGNDLVGLAEPARFKVEVPGQGFVSWTAGLPEIRKANLAPGTLVAKDTCASGNLHFAIGGEKHIEAVLFDTGDGVLRWAT